MNETLGNMIPHDGGERERRHHSMPLFLRILLILLALVLIAGVIFWIDTEYKSNWLYRQNAYIDSLYAQEDRMLENMQTFVNMLPPQRTDWSEQDKLSFDTLNEEKTQLYNQIDDAIREYNVNLSIWSKPLFNIWEKPWVENLDSSSTSSD